MRAFIVCVDYADLLGVTLPYNRHHFSEVNIVTSMTDNATAEVARKYDAQVFPTNAFYEDGAYFNKWKALEQCLDLAGRKGLICIMDADVMWPKEIEHVDYKVGYLYTPLRRMMREIKLPIPEESEWGRFPLHPQQREWAGYTQIFWGHDYHLPEAPWHQINWKHAGGADSFFQMLWTPQYKHRPSFEVLHLGPAGTNWCGRCTPTLDGETPKEAPVRQRILAEIFRQRRFRKPSGRFTHEKINPQ